MTIFDFGASFPTKLSDYQTTTASNISIKNTYGGSFRTTTTTAEAYPITNYTRGVTVQICRACNITILRPNDVRVNRDFCKNGFAFWITEKNNNFEKSYVVYSINELIEVIKFGYYSHQANMQFLRFGQANILEQISSTNNKCTLTYIDSNSTTTSPTL